MVNWDIAAGEDRLAHIDRCGDLTVSVDTQRHSFNPAVGSYSERIFPSSGSFGKKPRKAPNSVTAHFAAAAIGVVHLHPHVCIGRRTHHDKPVGTDPEPPIGNVPRKSGRVGRT